MSIGCYEEKDGQKTLVALNVCIVGHEGDDHELETLLHAMGLVVKREYRGRQLGQKLLAAREPLCLSQGIKGTATVFTGIGSQKPATKCGFHAIADFSIAEMAEAGLPYPKDDERRVKYMVKKYV
ncbi:Uncharacterized protein OBRU01_06366 [Operophtera brumata]|uniref:N-acetyltransferase domain-containing protein n=1 Tax=Operophtera brumata TaxID=104452 RepID=A0A0L7LKJ2_OPEBR|nr:Uncharacterized protein OBRU01_06366 [Operophtera brumata]